MSGAVRCVCARLRATMYVCVRVRSGLRRVRAYACDYGCDDDRRMGVAQSGEVLMVRGMSGAVRVTVDDEL